MQEAHDSYYQKEQKQKRSGKLKVSANQQRGDWE